ncbi:TPA: glycosyltransferase family 2 protein [Photobacterium damselae]
MNKNHNQIVTVAVITYHSADTVLETLDSILNQSYGSENIELIISDDSSKDNTVKLIEQWVIEHQSKFYCVKIFTNKVNEGISKNCNIAWKNSTSQWIKTIAGDDILMPNCLLDNIEFIKKEDVNKTAVIFSKMQSFKVNCDGSICNLSILPLQHNKDIFMLASERQFNYLQKVGISGAPSAFINKEALIEVDFADERFPMMEDHPLWFKMTQSGWTLKFMEKLTVRYRISDSVSNSNNRLINQKYIREIISVETKLIIPTLNKEQRLLRLRKQLWPNLAIQVAAVFNNKVTFISKLAIAIVYIIKPGFLSSQLKKVFK